MTELNSKIDINSKDAPLTIPKAFIEDINTF